MKRGRRQINEKPAIELIEEGVHLLRQAPLSTVALYYIGSLPFVVGLLYFWAEMSRSPFASEHLVGESLGLALLFVWMKLWQARFTRNLWSQISGHSRGGFGWRQWRNLVINQLALQVSGLVLLPLALVLTLPFAWVYAFYQSLTALEDVEEPGLRNAFGRAWKEAMLWPRQNHRLVLTLSAFGMFVFLDWTTVSLAVPMLLKTFLGIETVFSRSPMAVFNSTFFAAMAALTYLSVDPLMKAVYTFRCFYGEARTSGEDIKAELRQIAVGANGNAAIAIVSIVILGMVGLTASAAAGWAQGTIENRPSFRGRVANGQESSPEGTAEVLRRISVVPSGLVASIDREPNLEKLGYAQSSLRDDYLAGATAAIDTPNVDPGDRQTRSGELALPSASAVSPPELDKQIGETLKESKYTWRFPRDSAKKQADSEKNFLERFMERAGKWVESMRDWIAEKLRKWLRPRPGAPHSISGPDWMVFVQFLFYLLIAIVVLGAGFLIYYLVSKRGQKQTAIESVPIQPAPDVSDENVGAEHLPEDGWITLGRELLQKGELRLALRAFYLSSLANLASRNLINLARFKSNRDYQRELERRAHAFPQVLALFGDNVSVFDRIWYGMHETTPELVNQFLAKVERIKTA